MSDAIEWQDPPPRRTRRSWHAANGDARRPEYKAFYEQLKANPGRWAIFPGSVTMSKRLAHQGFERAMRDDVIYLRWPASDEAAGTLEGG